MTIGKRIRELRERTGLTQAELAMRLGVTPSAVGNYESGRSFPKEAVLYRMFGALGCEPNELFADFFYGSGSFGGQILDDEEDTATNAIDRHMEQYSALDEHGRALVDACTDIELRRVQSLQGAAIPKDCVQIAARGSKRNTGAIIRLKKREGGDTK